MNASIDAIIRQLLVDLDADSLDDSVEAARATQQLARREAEAATTAYNANKAPPPFRVGDKAVVSAMGREWMFRDLRLHIKMLTRQVTNTLLGDKSPFKEDVLLSMMGDVNHMHRIMEIRNSIADFAQPERMRLRKAALANKRKPTGNAPQQPQGASIFRDLRQQQMKMEDSLKQWTAGQQAPAPAQAPGHAEAAAFEAEHQEWIHKLQAWKASEQQGPAPKFPARVLNAMRITATHSKPAAKAVRELEEQLKSIDALPQSPEVSAPRAGR
ncbi:MAG: hypothetical protein IPK87_01975 [Planctomycetes bacterium]|nr:hypothetical protein [Planctomycetota bacterium]